MHSRPFLETISDPVSVGIVEFRLAQPVALQTALMVHFCVVLISRELTYGDCYLLAGPAVGNTILVCTCEPAHYMTIVRIRVILLIAIFSEIKFETVAL